MKPVLRQQPRGAVSVVGVARQGGNQPTTAVVGRRPLGNPRGTATPTTRYAGATGAAAMHPSARGGSRGGAPVHAPQGAARALVGARDSDGRAVNSAITGKGQRPVVVLRREIGDVLRDARQRQGRTLRQISAAARVSLGYLSEVERGQKEASSELLASICTALEVPMSLVLREVSERVAVAEGYAVPDTVPADLAASMAQPLVGVR